VRRFTVSPIHQAVLEALYNWTEASEEQLAHATALPIETIIRVLHDLEAEGFVERDRE
jgi:DNA-binding IclR family transcriptional regulator